MQRQSRINVVFKDPARKWNLTQWEPLNELLGRTEIVQGVLIIIRCEGQLEGDIVRYSRLEMYPLTDVSAIVEDFRVVEIPE